MWKEKDSLAKYMRQDNTRPGEPTSEWQPKGGEIYRFSVDLLEDDLNAPVPVELLEYAPMLAATF